MNVCHLKRMSFQTEQMLFSKDDKIQYGKSENAEKAERNKRKADRDVCEKEKRHVVLLTEQRNTDKDTSESAISKMKLFEDAIRNSAVKLGHDPLGLISF